MGEIKKGLKGVVVADSEICKVDGKKGVLYYRGYNINDFAGKASYEEVAYLLLFKKWATSSTNRLQSVTSQEELELLSDYQKTRIVHEINGEIAILEKQRKYLEAILNESDAPDLPEITQVQIDDSI